MAEWRPATLYDCLEVPRDATQEEITLSVRLLREVWSPDRFVGKAALTRKANDRTAQLNEAYQTLSDPRRRQEYDDTLPTLDLSTVVSAFPDRLQNQAAVWKRMATYMKEEDVGSGFLRKMAFTAGDLIERGLIPSDKQRPYMLQAWELAIAEGFDAESDE